MTATPRVLVLRPLGLGDFLTGVPAYRAIARAFPDHERILAAPAQLHDLLPLVDGAFHRAIDILPLRPLPAAFHDVDVAVDLHGRGPASQRVLLALAPRRLVSFRNAELRETHAGAPFVEDEHEVERWCRMLEHAGIASRPRELALHVPDEVPAVFDATIVHAGAASESRRWPVQRWADVVAHLEARGERVVLTGSEAERERATSIGRLAGLDGERNLAGRTTLRGLAALVAHAHRLVAGDTGIAHLATAFATPSVLLFGPTSPAHWGPPPESIHRVLWSGRLGDPHGSSIDPGLAAIGVRDVISALDVSFV